MWTVIFLKKRALSAIAAHSDQNQGNIGDRVGTIAAKSPAKCDHQAMHNI